MHLTNERINQLIVQYIKGTLNDIEKTELNKWLKHPKNRILFDKITDKQNIINKSICYDSYNIKQAWKNQRFELQAQIKSGRKWFAYAAATLLPLIVIATILFVKQIGINPQIAEHQILPGESNAMIYFSDGEIINLDSDTSNVFFKQNLKIKKLDKKLIIVSNDKLDAKIEKSWKLNKIETGRGNEMQIVLPDGTNVWLNADSYLEFPSQFNNNERRVKTKGEVYFEVSKDKKRSFIVETGQMSLKVLGTHFNVRYYPEEKHIVSTLIEGSVEISNFMDEKVLLIPGQSALLHRQTDKIEVQEVDVESAIAWKEGRFYFENQKLEVIMNELSRWYDFEFSFENDIMRNERFSVDVPRFENCNKILSKIEGTKVVKFNITKNGVTIY
jgi:hypothetical protein